jgi:hypothetical protein
MDLFHLLAGAAVARRMGQAPWWWRGQIHQLMY